MLVILFSMLQNLYSIFDMNYFVGLGVGGVGEGLLLPFVGYLAADSIQENLYIYIVVYVLRCIFFFPYILFNIEKILL